MAEADAVFFGRVAEMTVRSRESGQISSADLVTVEFDLIRVWKGPLRETLTVKTERMGISCGYEFREGRRYVVYTWDGNRTGLCTRTAPTWRAARDFATLGFDQSPEIAAEGVIQDGNSGEPRGGGCTRQANGGGIGADAATLALLAGVAVLGASRWRRR